MTGAFDHLEPIELTEETIKLLGFEICDLTTRIIYIKDSICVSFQNSKVFNSNFQSKLPKHVHKLQQLLKSLEE